MKNEEIQDILSHRETEHLESVFSIPRSVKEQDALTRIGVRLENTREETKFLESIQKRLEDRTPFEIQEVDHLDPDKFMVVAVNNKKQERDTKPVGSFKTRAEAENYIACLLYTSPSPRD